MADVLADFKLESIDLEGPICCSPILEAVFTHLD